jgi:putative nucleotidyltransferase with HDIG domain
MRKRLPRRDVIIWASPYESEIAPKAKCKGTTGLPVGVFHLMNNQKKKKLAAGIVKELRKKGFCAYFVGGCVRDMLMRKVPKDFDITTDARPAQVKKLFPQKTIPVGVQFNTLLLIRQGVSFQVSTFKGRQNDKSLSLLEDVRARDFTINGLVYDPVKEKIVDLVKGREDIRRKRICTIGRAAARFKEDPLRLIRAVRFAATLGFNIEKKTFGAIKKLAQKIRKVSAERVRDELILLFTAANPYLGLKLLDESGLLRQILPEVAHLKGVKQPQAFHPEGDVFSHTLLMFKRLHRPPLLLSFSCLLHDIGKPATFQVLERIRFNGHDRVGAELSDKILKRLKFPNKDREDIVACVANHMRMMDAPKMRDSTLKRLFARPTFELELRLHYIDCIASHKDLRVWRFLNRRFKEFKKRPLIPKPLLNGHELIKLGFTPGPIFGKIHKRMVDLQLEGRLKKKSEVEKWVKSKFKSLKVESSKQRRKYG